MPHVTDQDERERASSHAVAVLRGVGPMTRPLHVLAPGAVGGAETVVIALSRGQRAAGHEARVVALVEPDGGQEFLRRMEGTDVPVHPLRVPHRSYWREARELASLFDRQRPDVVHTHGYHSDVVAGLTARSRGVPRISTVHGFTGGGWKNRLYEHVDRRVLRGFPQVVAVSESVADRLRADGVPPERITVIRNAWQPDGDTMHRGDAREELGLPADGYVVGWVGRLSREKGADVALRAMERLEGAGRLSVVGTGREAEALRSQAESLGIADRVRFHGMVPDAFRFLSAFDVFLLSSRTEGTPMVVYEAVHAGVPLVATAVGGVPELVGPGEARLVPPEDPAALASALAEVRENPADARRRAERARDRIRREFGIEAWVEKYERAYRRTGATGHEGRG